MPTHPFLTCRTRGLRRTLTTALMLGGLTPLAGAVPLAGAHHAITLSDADDGKDVTLHPGDTLTVRLMAHTDGGYLWHVVWAGSNDLLVLKSDTSAPPRRQPGMVGGSGTRTFRFVVKTTGMGDGVTLAEWLRFVELRPFEKGIVGAATFQAHVIVAAPNPVSHSHRPAAFLPHPAPIRGADDSGH